MSVLKLLTQSILTMVIITPALSIAAECSSKSGNQVVPLIELYTSEGCSSCPPADKWLSRLKDEKNKVTPIAFHVDYWDYIGWKDRFAKNEFSKRQRKMADITSASYVYTPQILYNGRDFKGWDDGRLNSTLQNDQKLVANVNLMLDAFAESNGNITLKASAKAMNLELTRKVDVFVALYENNLMSQVKAGENSGSTLKHDFVVRNLFGAFQINNLNQFQKNFTLSEDWKNKDAGAVMFAQDSLTGEVLQSLQLKFCE
jgi:hypothetical protein